LLAAIIRIALSDVPLTFPILGLFAAGLSLLRNASDDRGGESRVGQCRRDFLDGYHSTAGRIRAALAAAADGGGIGYGRGSASQCHFGL
jgi:hypothetical protein